MHSVVVLLPAALALVHPRLIVIASFSAVDEYTLLFSSLLDSRNVCFHPIANQYAY